MSRNMTRKPEMAGEINGVKGRFYAVVDRGDRIANQKFFSTRYLTPSQKRKHGMDRITVKMRFDDKCKNGHETFTITATGYRGKHDQIGGCCHDLIVAIFPEFKPLIKWHSVSTDGPLNYVANTVYHAGNKDCWGRAKEEPSQFDTVVRIGNSPITHKVKSKFWNWISEKICDSDFEWIIEEYSHERGSKTFSPNYTFAGFGSKWHECPFSSRAEAMQWFQAFTNDSIEISLEKIATEFSEGKERDFEAARKVSLWPDATDEQLSLPKAELTELLEKRLPPLLDEFLKTMSDCGFIFANENNHAI